MPISFASPESFDGSEFGLLDGLRAEYVAAVIRFFTGISDIWVVDKFGRNSEYGVVMLARGEDLEGVEGAVKQVSGGHMERVMMEQEDRNVAGYQFSVGSEGLETNFSLLLSENISTKRVRARLHRI